MNKWGYMIYLKNQVGADSYGAVSYSKATSAICAGHFPSLSHSTHHAILFPSQQIFCLYPQAKNLVIKPIMIIYIIMSSTFNTNTKY